MAISPPSDLVLDVVRAADPANVQAAQEKLKASRAAVAANSLAEKGAGFTSSIDLLNSAGTKAGLGNADTATSKEIPESYHKFEAMVLQSFVKSMLPESEEIYGKGNAGEIYKSMMAEQFGNVLAKNGGVGIAEQMFSQSVARAQNKEVSNVVTDENERKLALSMITDFERRTFGVEDAEGKKSEKL